MTRPIPLRSPPRLGFWRPCYIVRCPPNRMTHFALRLSLPNCRQFCKRAVLVHLPSFRFFVPSFRFSVPSFRYCTLVPLLILRNIRQTTLFANPRNCCKNLISSSTPTFFEQDQEGYPKKGYPQKGQNSPPHFRAVYRVVCKRTCLKIHANFLEPCLVEHFRVPWRKTNGQRDWGQQD